jgi:hypothetical protein
MVDDSDTSNNFEDDASNVDSDEDGNSSSDVSGTLNLDKTVLSASNLSRSRIEARKSQIPRGTIKTNTKRPDGLR